MVFEVLSPLLAVSVEGAAPAPAPVALHPPVLLPPKQFDILFSLFSFFSLFFLFFSFFVIIFFVVFNG